MYKGQNATVISSLMLDNTAVLKTGWLHNYRATGRRASNNTPRTYVCFMVQPSIIKRHLLKLGITVKILWQNEKSLWRALASSVWSCLQITPRSSFSRDSLLTTMFPNGFPKGSRLGQGPLGLGFPHCYLTQEHKLEYLRWDILRHDSSGTGICLGFIWDLVSLGLDFSGNH